jgi:hypothetical protein
VPQTLRSALCGVREAALRMRRGRGRGRGEGEGRGEGGEEGGEEGGKSRHLRASYGCLAVSGCLAVWALECPIALADLGRAPLPFASQPLEGVKRDRPKYFKAQLSSHDPSAPTQHQIHASLQTSTLSIINDHHLLTTTPSPPPPDALSCESQ